MGKTKTQITVGTGSLLSSPVDHMNFHVNLISINRIVFEIMKVIEENVIIFKYEKYLDIECFWTKIWLQGVHLEVLEWFYICCRQWWSFIQQLFILLYVLRNKRSEEKLPTATKPAFVLVKKFRQYRQIKTSVSISMSVCSNAEKYIWSNLSEGMSREAFREGNTQSSGSANHAHLINW